MHAFKPHHLVALFVFTVATARAQDAATPDSFFIHDGDTPVVFLGDSITEQGRYNTLIETYVLTRFPNLKVTFRNAGWNGDTSWLAQRGDFDTSLQRDVLSLKPKVVMIDFGMNDARGGDGNYQKYLDSISKLVQATEKAGARVALLTPSPEEKYEEGAPAGSHYNLMLKKYADGLKTVADNEKVPLIDQLTPFETIIDAGRKAGVLSATDGPDVPRLTNDNVHPNWGGHLIMAVSILRAMHAPAKVSSISVDAAAHSITASSGCTAEWHDIGDGSVQFQRTDDAIPWPIPSDPAIDTAMKIPGFDPATTLNSYMLQATGLTGKSYKLSIDNKLVGTYAAADLAAGINLGFTRQGPIYDQGQDLLLAVTNKNKAYYERWRRVQLAEIPEWLKKYKGTDQARTDEMARLDKEILADEQNIEKLRKPIPHIFKLEPVK